LLTAAEGNPVSSQTRETLTAMAQNIKQPSPKSALPVQSLISNRLKIDFLPVVNPTGLAGRLLSFFCLIGIKFLSTPPS
jgi:hypothetical protein